MKWKQWGVIVSLLGFIWFGVQLPDGKLHIIFCDVGQGDATLVIKGDFQILVDGGPSGSRVLSCLSHHMPFWDRTIEVVVNTHAEQDHLGGLPEVLGRYGVGRLVINGEAGETEAARKIATLVREKKIKVQLPKAGDVIRYTNINIDILWPEEIRGSTLAWTDITEGEKVLGKASGLNQTSVVLLLTYGEFKALLTGDIEEKQELALGDMGMLTDVDVLKIAHHGSKTSSNEWFLSKVKPEESVVSVGEKNSFGHPTAVVLDRLDTLRSRLWRTDLNGEVEVVTNGNEYTVNGAKKL